MKKIKIAVAGAGGRMGRRILALAGADSDFQIAGALEREDSPAVGADVGTIIGCESLGVEINSDAKAALKQAQVLIDFTHPNATEEHVAQALEYKLGLVIGTTGLSERTRSALKKASSRIAIVQSPNMSLGANLLFELARRAAEVLNWDAEVSEIHHRMKKDAPSGTALELASLIALARGWDEKSFLYGRRGETGERKKDTIAIHALRGGDVVGEHTVSFLGDGETVELVHRATSRDAFARGALLAAKFVAGRRKGLYNMRDLCASLAFG